MKDWLVRFCATCQVIRALSIVHPPSTPSWFSQVHRLDLGKLDLDSGARRFFLSFLFLRCANLYVWFVSMWLLVFVPAILQSSVFNFKSNHGPMISRSLRKSEAHLLIGMYLMVVMVFYLSSLIKKKMAQMFVHFVRRQKCYLMYEDQTFLNECRCKIKYTVQYTLPMCFQLYVLVALSTKVWYLE